jgi:DUF971 family protein
MTPQTTPLKLNLKRDEKLEIVWQDGRVSTYTLDYLRALCPCAQCRTVREGAQVKKKTSLSILPGNYSEPLKVVSAAKVGNYAIQIEWSDQHESGIYSYDYLREIDPVK